MSNLLDKIDFNAVEHEIAELVEDALEEVVDAAQRDLKKFGKAIAFNLVTAIRTDRPDLVRSLKGQARMLAEVQRIHLNRRAKQVLNSILDVAARVGKVFLTAAVAAV